ncbi:sorting nexin-21 [Bombina bombina]|uniref:sorting nexin-21 n=1 Tax=Bombina bombina TaxID=8345 RepID=UPI00235B2588|nr:sorting nexin-21 [Bombina bombina]XP_053545384.1 sorting nexin-21 [Bombina bombina]
MASKILQRLRPSTQQEEIPPVVTEEAPEIADLVDDMDGLSVRLSGTLSLSEDSLGSEESDETEERPIEEWCPSPLLTQQMREVWASSQSHSVPIRLTFEVTEANVIRDGYSKYVVYTIFIMQSGQYDSSPASISCRYSDLECLRRKLRALYPKEMRDVSFPRKRLRKNFTAETIAKRSRAFEQFLSHVSSLPALLSCPTFLCFFYLKDIQRAQHLTCNSLYKLALPVWINIWHLQEKLCPATPSTHRFLVLAGLVVCHQEMDELVEAQDCSERAVSLLQEAQDSPFLVPFLLAHIQLSWRVGRDKRDSETTLQKLQADGSNITNSLSLKDILNRETID